MRLFAAAADDMLTIRFATDATGAIAGVCCGPWSPEHGAGGVAPAHRRGNLGRRTAATFRPLAPSAAVEVRWC